MRTKVLTLGLICLFIFAYCNSPADPEIEKALNPEPVDPPIIEYFSVVHLQGRNFTLCWCVVGAETVRIDQGIGEVSLIGEMEVQVLQPITYTLTAFNNGEQSTASVTIDLSGQALLEITTIPEVPVFIFQSIGEDDDDGNDYYYSSFYIVVTETNGVGGDVEVVLRFAVSTGPFFVSTREFEPFGTISLDVDVRHYWKEPTDIEAEITGVDDNGNSFALYVTIPVVVGS